MSRQEKQRFLRMVIGYLYRLILADGKKKWPMKSLTRIAVIGYQHRLILADGSGKNWPMSRQEEFYSVGFPSAISIGYF